MLHFSALHGITSQNEHFTFETLDKAFDHLENGRPHYRCVVNVKDYSKQHGLWK